MIINRVKLTQSQISNTARLLAQHNPAVHGTNIDSIAVKIRKAALVAASNHTQETDTFTISTGGYVLLVWTLPLADREECGYDREVEVLIDPSILIYPDGDVVENVAPTNTKSCPYIRYIHMRYYDVWKSQDGTVVSRTINQYGGVTIAFFDNFDGTLTYSIARCHNRDLYVRRTGREIAKQRVLADRYSNAEFVGSINEFRPWIEQQIQRLS